MSSFSVMMVPFFFIYSKSMNFFSELHFDPKTSAVSLSDDDTRLSLFLDYGSLSCFVALLIQGCKANPSKVFYYYSYV